MSTSLLTLLVSSDTTKNKSRKDFERADHCQKDYLKVMVVEGVGSGR